MNTLADKLNPSPQRLASVAATGAVDGARQGVDRTQWIAASMRLSADLAALDDGADGLPSDAPTPGG